MSYYNDNNEQSTIVEPDKAQLEAEMALRGQRIEELHAESARLNETIVLLNARVSRYVRDIQAIAEECWNAKERHGLCDSGWDEFVDLIQRRVSDTVGTYFNKTQGELSGTVRASFTLTGPNRALEDVYSNYDIASEVQGVLDSLSLPSGVEISDTDVNVDFDG
jgi:predicted nuclease with TOPRIM domain